MSGQTHYAHRPSHYAGQALRRPPIGPVPPPHEHLVGLLEVGRGPAKRPERDGDPVRDWRVGETVDALLDDGRVVRAKVRVASAFGAVWLEGIPTRMIGYRVRARGGWALECGT